MSGKPIGHALAVAAMLALASEPSLTPARPAPRAGPWPTAVAGACPAPGTSALEVMRATFAVHRDAPGKLRRLAVGLGASLAWDLADLPRRHARLPDPIDGFAPGNMFHARGVMCASHGDGPDGEIGWLIARWNALYPPYVLPTTEKY